MKSGNFDAALKKLRPFADAGDITAQRALGEIYAEGLGVPPDPVLAGIWFRRAECRCESPGQAEYDTSLRLMRGESSHESRATAAAWLVRAAEAGHPRAQAVLASRTELKEKGWEVAPEVSEYWAQIIAQRQRPGDPF